MKTNQHCIPGTIRVSCRSEFPCKPIHRHFTNSLKTNVQVHREFTVKKWDTACHLSPKAASGTRNKSHHYAFRASLFWQKPSSTWHTRQNKHTTQTKLLSEAGLIQTRASSGAGEFQSRLNHTCDSFGIACFQYSTRERPNLPPHPK